jgi:hypothetical protein
MIIKLKNYKNEAKNKNITEQQLESFFKIGLELNIFRVIGNEGSQLIYETNENHTTTGPEILLNESGKKNPIEIKNHDVAENFLDPKKTEQTKNQGSRAAPVGNTVTTGWNNPFGGTSWGK